MAWSLCIKNVKLLKCIIHKVPAFFIIWKKYQNLVFQIAIVKVLYEIRLLSGKSYWKYGCKWRWFVRSLNWCVDSGKLWILDIEVLGKVDISNCHRRLWQRIRQVDYKMYTWEIPQGLWKRRATHNAIFLKLVTALLLWGSYHVSTFKFYLWCMFHYESTSTEIWYSTTLTQGWRIKLCRHALSRES